MQTVIIVIHLLVVIGLVGVVLIQRSEGGGLGIGGGSGFMTARGTKNALTRLTAILAACFFITSIILTVMQLVPGKDGSHILREIPAQEQKGNNLLDSLGGPKTENQNKAGGTQDEAVPAASQNTAPQRAQGANANNPQNNIQKPNDKTVGEGQNTLSPSNPVNTEPAK